jgi:radical SAM protein with 4Fe4S-binding SPASM domain
LEKIEITVYGMHPASYDACACTPGAFVEFRRGIDLLIENQVPFMVKGAILPSNLAELDEFETWAATLPWTDEPPGYSMFYDLRARRDSPARNNRINQLRLSPEQGVAVLTRRSGRYVKEMRQFCARYTGPGGKRLFNCGAGQGGSVDAYGRYQPCMLLRDPALSYDLKAGSLEDALKNFFPRLRIIEAQNPVYLERCSNCFLLGLCEQCPAKSWSEHGTLDTPVNYLCDLAHAQGRFLGLLTDGEKAWEVKDWKERLKRFEMDGRGV